MANAAELAYMFILDRILAGDLAPGERLREEELAKKLGVSRTPIREAIRRLAAEGLIEVEANRGALIPKIDPREVDEIFDLRALLEGYGAEQATLNISRRALSNLREFAEEMRDEVGKPQIDLGRLAGLNTAFHQGIFNGAANSHLINIRYLVTRLPLIYRTYRLYTREELIHSVNQHIEIVTAVGHGDQTWAGNAMRAHILAARRVVGSASRDDQSLAVRPGHNAGERGFEAGNRRGLTLRSGEVSG